jgi:hypothetical protein
MKRQDEQEMKMAKDKVVASMSRQINYPDGSGPKAAVEYDSTYRLGRTDEDLARRYVQIAGIGGDIRLEVTDVSFIIEALQEALRVDELVVD